MRIHPGGGNGLLTGSSRGSTPAGKASASKAEYAQALRTSNQSLFGTRKRDLNEMLAEAAANTANASKTKPAKDKPNKVKARTRINVRRW